MNNIKNTFTIKDLENLTGIKAHTIRMWEKRYDILSPMRTNTNIRVYDARSLQKLLNINTLNAFGYKISNIAKLTEEHIPQLVKEIMVGKTVHDRVLRNFKLAMVNFDTKLFVDAYNNLLATKPFREIFYDCFMPLLEEIGNLWQTGTITPAHEHFISNLVKQKIMMNTEPLQATEPTKTERTYVLFLPEGEIHEIGLMLINYELLFNGYNTVYLGESIPLKDLAAIKERFENITLVTYATIQPTAKEITLYVEAIKEQVLDDETTQLVLCGRGSSFINTSALNDKIKIYKSVKEYSKTL